MGAPAQYVPPVGIAAAALPISPPPAAFFAAPAANCRHYPLLGIVWQAAAAGEVFFYSLRNLFSWESPCSSLSLIVCGFTRSIHSTQIFYHIIIQQKKKNVNQKDDKSPLLLYNKPYICKNFPLRRDSDETRG